MLEQFSIFVLSDIHLGHNTNKTEDIIFNVRKLFKTYHTQITKADMIAISGDTFDRLLSANSAEMIMIKQWLSELVLFCKGFNIKLRILEGTPSHDWKQVKIIYSIIEALDMDVDFRYVESLSIEHLDEEDINILYLPDEWNVTAKDIYKDVQLKLREHNLKTVDVIIMHGAFTFQLPDFIENLHNPDNYIDICKGPIICGHVHKHSVYKNILIPGSIDSLTHEDDDVKKGALMIHMNLKNSTFKYRFLENKNRLKFRTIDVGNSNIQDIRSLLNKIKQRRQYLRLITDNFNTLKSNIKELHKLFPHLNLKIEKRSDKKVDKILNPKRISRDIIKLDKSIITNHILEEARKDGIDIKVIVNELQKLTDVHH